MALKSGDELLVMACDGLWDVMGSQDAVDFVLEHLKARPADAGGAADGLAKRALALGTSDNVSVLVMLFE